MKPPLILEMFYKFENLFTIGQKSTCRERSVRFKLILNSQLLFEDSAQMDESLLVSSVVYQVMYELKCQPT